MRLAVLGAAGGVGAHAVRIAAERHHEVMAGARRPQEVPELPRCDRFRVDVHDLAAVERLVEGAQAVVWCIGVTKTSGGDVGRAALPGLVSLLERHGIERFVGVSGAGVTLPGDAKGVGPRLVSTLTRTFASDLVDDKQGEHDALAASSLAWTQVRPPRLVEREGVGSYHLGRRAPGFTAKPVTKADVALALLDLAETREWAGQAPFLTAG